MPKRRYIFTVDATIAVDLDTPERDDEAAHELAHAPILCSQCSDELEVGDVMELIDVIDLES